MHGDDVASAGVEVTTQIVSKATELFMEMLKIAIEREREKNRLSEKSEVLSGGEVTYQRLKEGGEVTMLPSFAKEDYGEFLKQAKKMDIPVAAIRESGKENTLSVFFNVKDKEAVNSIVQGIVREKMKTPEQTERMITIEKEQVEGFQTYCSEHDIPVNFMETKNDVKCIFNSAYEKQIAAAVENYRQVQKELSKAEIKVQADERGRPKIIVSDTEQGKRLSMNFCTKAKLERVLQERLGFSKVKALEAALCFYLVECESKKMQNFSEVMRLLKKAEVKEGEDNFQSDLDLIFDALEFPEKYTKSEAENNEQFKKLNLIDLAKKAKSANQYMCLKYYKDFKKAAGDTAKSILISTAVRLQAFNISEVMDMTCYDNLHLEELGDEKQVLYIIIPSSDDTFNFLAAMMYTQMFDVLYDRANFKYGGRLPVHVRCLLDEFANVGTIPRFEEFLATMRSMEIFANVIIQNISQQKILYKNIIQYFSFQGS